MAKGYIEVRHTFLTVIDFETTGTVPNFPVEPWQVGIVRIRDSKVCVDETFESLIHVGERPFNPHAPGRHAQLRAELANAPHVSELWPILSAWVTGTTLVAHNVGTERSVLTRWAPLHRFGPWIDTLALVRHAYPTMSSHTLSDVIAALGLAEQVSVLSPERLPHDALYDAVACAVLLEYLLKLPGWEHVTVAALAEVY